MRRAIRVILFLLGGFALAQQSASFRQSEHALNEGGHPESGIVLISAGFHIRFDAVGDPALAATLGSASYRMDPGFIGAYPPPGEVSGLRFIDAATLTWDPERSAGVYNAYRDLVSTLPGGFGSCLQGSIGSASTVDAATPASGKASFYLVTAENRLGEEGTKGFRSSGVMRGNAAPCP